jgi:hypothetical protein
MRIGKKKRPRDVNQKAFSVLQDVIGLTEKPRKAAKKKKG